MLCGLQAGVAADYYSNFIDHDWRMPAKFPDAVCHRFHSAVIYSRVLFVGLDFIDVS
jgi:hypothetical protein